MLNHPYDHELSREALHGFRAVSLKLNKATYTSTSSRFHRGAELPGKPNALESNPIAGGQLNLLESDWENQLGRALLEFRVHW